MAFVYHRSEGHPRSFFNIFTALYVAMCWGRPVASEEAPADTDPPPDYDDDAFLEALPAATEPALTTEVHGYRLHRTDEATAFADTIEVADHARTMSSVGEVVSQAVGVRVRTAGGLGAYGAASIRGSTARQVPVYLDGIEVRTGGTAAVNLGDFSLDAFKSIEVYRGGAPLTAGASGIGGALFLETRQCDEAGQQAAVSYGSWQTWRGFGLTCARLGAVKGLAILSATGSDGDFRFLNRGGTLLNPSDDRIERRTNHHHTAYHTLLKVDGDMGSWRWTAANALYSKAGGVPGTESIVTRRSSVRTLRDDISLRFEGPISKRVDAALTAGYSGGREVFLHPEPEFNQTATRIAGRTHLGQLGGLLGVTWSKQHASYLRVHNHLERFDHEERTLDGPVVSQPMKRVRTALGVGHDYRPRPPFLLSPLIAIDIHQLRFPAAADPTGDGTLDALSRNRVYWSPSLGTKWQIRDGVALRANGGRYVRAPDLTELFGYAGSVMGNPNLKEEVGMNADLGVTLDHQSSGALSRARLDCAWFGSMTDDLIAYEQNSQNTVRPENVSKAAVTGAEAALNLVWLHALFLDANYTYLYGVNRSDTPYYRGNRLPGHPAHAVYAKLEARGTAGRLLGGAWIDADAASDIYLKRSNQREFTVPSRVLLGCGYRLSHPESGITITLAVKNMMNRISFTTRDGTEAPLADYVGFPLPGRTILFTLHWKG